jgi:hypothetical protein
MLILLYKQVFMSKLKLLVLFICFLSAPGFAQDSLKKKPPVKTHPEYAYKHHSRRYYYAKADSVAKSPVQAGEAKPDSVAAAAPVLTDKSLNGQYQYLLSKVYRYQQPLISALWKNASDTLNANRSKLRTALGKIAVQNKTADSLNTEISTLSETNARKDGVDIFGLDLPMSTYNLIVWGLVAVFGIIAIVVIGRSAAHRREARYRTQLFTELEEEFKTFKTKANDKEKKLARELQTERNKLDELLGRG